MSYELIKEYPSEIEAQFAANDYSFPVEVMGNKLYAFTRVETKKHLERHVLEEPEVWLVTSKDCLLELRALLEKYESKIVSWDTETTGLGIDAELVGIGCCWGNPKVLGEVSVAYIPIQCTSGDSLKKDLVLETLKPILESEKHPKVFQNGKYDIKVFLRNNINVKGFTDDTMILHWLLNCQERVSHKIEDAIRQYYNCAYSIPTYDDLLEQIKIKGIAKAKKTLAMLPSTVVAAYCGMDCYHTWMLLEALQKELKHHPHLQYIYSIEMECLPILIKLEIKGLKIDYEWYKQKSIEYYFKKQDFVMQFQQWKKGINLNSVKQLNDYFFNELKLPTDNLEKNKNGYSLNVEALKQIKNLHPTIDLLLKYRKTEKIITTYINGILDKVNQKTSRIHPEFNPIGTVTGRYSSQNPNGQNFPVDMRGGIVADDGCYLVSIDFSGCEYRILAHMAQCKRLIDGYLKNEDAHTSVTKLFFPGKNPKDINPENGKDYRFMGKQYNFGIVYGKSPEGMAIWANKPLEEILKNYDIYWQYLPEVKELMEQTHKKAVAYGYSETLLGRKRMYSFKDPFYIEQKGKPWEYVELRKNNHPHDAEIFRQSFNARIQGSNADLTKLAMIDCERFFSQNNLETSIVLQIHDELVFQVPIEEMAIIPDLCNIMSSVIKLAIPLEVSCSVGKTWKETKG